MSLNRRDVNRDKTARMASGQFAAIAEALRDAKPVSHFDPERYDHRMAQWESTINAFIVICKRSNSSFKPERFRAACNWEG